MSLRRMASSVHVYHRVLTATRLVIEPLERSLANITLPDAPGIPAPSLLDRTAFLRRDEAYLQSAGNTGSDMLSVTRTQPVLPPLEVHDLPSAVGVLYVMEGSALGGKVIAEAVSLGLGLTPKTGLSYHTGLGEQTLARWHCFRTWAEQMVITPDEREQSAQAAERVFHAFLITMTAAEVA